ncbi:MAG: leucine-rich repeat domain-containing protein [Clostridia bacterium]|nr:leucine-rich repeat domain-containing protein [Clostridia bacterium]
MSSFNNIRKIKYTPTNGEVVSLNEYILFEDERAEEKYAVFKFINNVNQQLLGFEFEVNEYNSDGELVEKTVVIYNKFSAKAQQAFVPKAKLKINYACHTLSVKLRKAAFDRFIWNDGEYTDNSYKFTHYAADEKTEQEKRRKYQKPVKEKKKREEAPEKEKIYEPYVEIKDKMRKNIAKFPVVFSVFICIAVVAYIAVSLFLFAKKSNSFTLEGFDLRIIGNSGTEVSVYGYESEEKALIIPEKIGDYRVTKIETGAFKNTDIVSVTLEMPYILIESGAFENCGKLKTVSATYATKVVMYENSFINCKPYINLPNCEIYPAEDAENQK